MGSHDVRNDTRQEQALLVFVRRLLDSISAGPKSVQSPYVSYHEFRPVGNTVLSQIFRMVRLHHLRMDLENASRLAADQCILNALVTECYHLWCCSLRG